jgi:hypothetical protein
MSKLIKLNLGDIENIVKNTINEMMGDEPEMTGDEPEDMDEPQDMGGQNNVPPPLLIGRDEKTGDIVFYDTVHNKMLKRVKR